MQEPKKSQNESVNNSESDINRWNTIAREYDAHITRGDFFRTQLLDPTLHELLDSVNGKRILDAGCGQGYLAHEFSRRGARVTAIDGAEALIALAREHYGETGELHFETHDLLRRFPFPDAAFDMAVANMVLMDLDPIAPVMREIARTLKSEGTFVFSVLHPLFVNGVIRKGLREYLTRALPFYALHTYATPHKKEWHIPGTTRATHVYARPLEFYARALRDAGFFIEDAREPVFSRETVRGKNGAMRLLAEIPMFLVIRAHKHS